MGLLSVICASVGSRSPVRRRGVAWFWIALITMLALSASPAIGQNRSIDHFGRNQIRFAAIDRSPLPEATGTGIIEYKGGKEPSSQWRASFQFAGLEPEAGYTVVIRGRFGAPGSVEATAFTPLCSFVSGAQGEGGCFWYFRGLARLTLLQLRAGDENGSEILEARRGRGSGAIETERNRHSPGGELRGKKK